MSRVQTLEQSILSEAEMLISSNTKCYEERMTLLEATAAKLSGADVREYWKKLRIIPEVNCLGDEIVCKLTDIIKQSEIPSSLAISALAREPLTLEQQKKDGVFYTDYRLAMMMGKVCRKNLKEETTVADLAAGTGILLAAVSEEYRNKYSEHFSTWISSHVFAFDLSKNALRGACAAFLSMTTSIDSLKRMKDNWKSCDSLFDKNVSSQKYDLIIGNPPWGKVKLTRHRYLKIHGNERNYGDDYLDFDSDNYEKARKKFHEYSKLIRHSFNNLGTTEPDLYMAFLQRALNLIQESGQIVYLLPAGLIRSQGTQLLREQLFKETYGIEFKVLDNKKRYFSIDTRFKFLMLTCKKGIKDNKIQNKFTLEIVQDAQRSEPVTFKIEQLRNQRPDLTIPEVKTIAEKNLLDKIYQNGRLWGTTNDEWRVDILREVDMTNDRKLFVSKREEDQLPIVEGRMIQQHRFGAKAYITGHGRSAVWKPTLQGFHAQYYIPTIKLPEKLQIRSRSIRAGYCDIAGQTNERAMTSAIIPAGVVCGNKVPTIVFPNDSTGDMLYLWVGITNSFVFDWVIRRIISTTVNYFLLFSVPVPDFAANSKLARTIIDCTKKLAIMDKEFYTDSEMPKLRVNIDVSVAKAYGIDAKDLSLILDDFPLIDRGQPQLPNKHGLTVTKDLLLKAMETGYSRDLTLLFHKYEEINAKAYIPAEMINLTRR